MTDLIDYEPHPLAERYPLMEGEDFEELKADILENGQNEAVWLLGDQIIDGRNRHLACMQLGIPTKTMQYHGTAEEAARFVVSQNERRRHLTPEWRRKRVQELRGQGMSIRAIAHEVRASVGTVHSDLAAGVQLRTPDPDQNDAAGGNGFHLPPPEPDSPVPPAATDTEVYADERQQEVEPVSEPVVVGPAVGAAGAADTPRPEGAGGAEAPPAVHAPPVPKVNGSDGKKYPGTQKKKPKQKAAAKVAPMPGGWEAAEAALATAAAALTAAVENIVAVADSRGVPQPDKPWKTLEVLDKNGQLVLNQSVRLRRRWGL